MHKAHVKTIIENCWKYVLSPQRISLPTCIFNRNIRGKTSKVKWLFESNFATSKRVSVTFQQSAPPPPPPPPKKKKTWKSLQIFKNKNPFKRHKHSSQNFEY